MQKNYFSNLIHQIWLIFLNGLLTLLPITLTIALFTFSYRLIKSWLAPIKQFEPAYLQNIPNAEIILVIAIIFCTGLFIKLFLLEPIIHFIESVFFKIPLMRPIYGGIKQLVQAFTVQDKVTFKKVVFVQFPRHGIYSIGFLTSEVPADISPENRIKYFNVFIPTTPNPTSGFLIQAPEQEIIILNLTRQEAMSIIISGGIIQPDRFKI